MIVVELTPAGTLVLARFELGLRPVSIEATPEELAGVLERIDELLPLLPELEPELPAELLDRLRPRAA